MTNFLDVQPTVENRWRALLLFGRNVATYKFALGRALLQLREIEPDDRIPLEELALPYAHAICEHLKNAPKQATSASSRFLDRLLAPSMRTRSRRTSFETPRFFLASTT